VQDQPSTSEDKSEPPGTIPDDFIWDPEEQAWFAPGEPVNWDFEAERRELAETLRQVREECIADGTWGKVIRVGPLPEIPQWMRKSLRNKPPEHLPLFPDDDTGSNE
jgi:hypothetical protein